MYLRSHEVHADFKTLNIYGKSLLRLPNGHAVQDIMDYDEKHVLDDPIFQPFVTGKKGSSAPLAFEAVIPKDTFLSDRLARNDDEETTWVQEAINSLRHQGDLQQEGNDRAGQVGANVSHNI